MPQPGGPESERRGEIHIRLSRRELLRYGGYGLAALGGAGLLGALQRLTSTGETRSVVPTPQPPQPLSPAERAVLPQQLIEKIERERGIPTPTPEKQRGVVLVKEAMIPERWPRDGIKAVVASEDFVFYTGRDGRLAALSLSGRKEIWQSEEKGIPLGAEEGIVYILRDDNRLFALDYRNKGAVKWRSITQVREKVLRPPGLSIGKEIINLAFLNSNQIAFNDILLIIKKTGPNAGGIVWQGEGKAEGIYQEIKISGEIKTSVPIRKILGMGNFQFDIVDANTGVVHGSPAIKGGFWGAVSGEDLYGYISGGRGTQIVAGKFGQEGFLWKTQEDFDTAPFLVAKVHNLYVYEGWKRQMTVISKDAGVPFLFFPYNLLPFGRGDFFEEIANRIIVSYEQSGVTRGFMTKGGPEWVNDDLRFSRIAGVTDEVVVAVYNDPDGRKSPEVVAFELNTGKRKWAPQEIKGPTHKVIIHKDKAVFGTGNSVGVLDVNSGKDAIPPIKLPAQPVQIMSHEDFLLVASGTPGKIGSLQVIKT